MRKQDDYDYGLRQGIFGDLNIWQVGVAVLLAVLGLSLYAIVQFQGVRDPAAMEQAHIARQLANGEGFTTQVMRPFDLWLIGLTPEEMPESIPALWHAPLYPHVLSRLFRFMRLDTVFTGRGVLMPEARAMVPLGIVLLILTSMIIWLLASSCFDERVARLAFVVLLVSPISLQIMLSGGALALAMFLSALSAYLAWLAIDSSFQAPHVWRVLLFSALAGILSGLLFLAHYAALLVGVGLLVWLALNLQRLRRIAVSLFAATMLVIVLPRLGMHREAGWWGLAAYPYGALLDTTMFSADSLLRDGDPVLRNWQVLQAIRDGIAARYMDFFTGRSLLGAGVIFIFFVAGLFGREERHWNQHAKWIVAGILFLLPVFPPVVGCPYGHWPVLFPLMVILGAQCFMRILDQEDFFDVGVRPVLFGFLVALCVLPSAIGLVQRDASSPYPPYHGPLQAYAAQWLPRDEVLLTDIPWATAWYGQQPSLLWPKSVEDAEAYLASLGGIYLADSAIQLPGTDPGWIYMRQEGVVPESLPFRTGLFLPAGERGQILLLPEMPESD